MRWFAFLTVLPLALCVPNPIGEHNQFQLYAPWDAKENGISQAWSAVKGALHWLDKVAFAPTQEALEHAENRSVYERLLAEERFSKFVFLLSQDTDAVNYLSDKNESFTLFAPANIAFPPSKAHKLPEDLGDPTSLVTLYHYFVKFPTDEGDNERRRAIVKHILHTVLKYHILPDGPHSALSLSRNSTVATALTLPHSTLLSTPQRIHILPSLKPLPTLALNFGTYVLFPDIAAVNGVIHAVNKPLAVPESIMDGTYRVPWLVGHGRAQYIFSDTASALAKTGLDSVLSWAPTHAAHSSGFSTFEDELEASGLAPSGWHWHGEPAVTFFAPTNKAWEALPPELTKFLFGPFGGSVLKKLLQYHIINGTVVFADWVKTTTVASPLYPDLHTEAHRSDLHVTLPSLLPSHPLSIHIVSNRILPIPREPTWYKVDVQNKHVEIVDWVARNGAVQVLGEVLNPLHGKKGTDGKESGESEWDGWEDWLVKWGDEA